jgi:hypothetical protein
MEDEMKRSDTRKLLVLAGSAALVGATLVGGATAANAAMPVVPTVSDSVINKSKQSYFTASAIIGGCIISSNGGTCSVSRGLSASRTIEVSLNVSRGFVSGQLGISSNSTVTTTTTCSSPALKAGQRWWAHPVGNRWSYQVRKTTTLAGRVSNTNTSGVLHAFDPFSSVISCGLS